MRLIATWDRRSCQVGRYRGAAERLGRFRFLAGKSVLADADYCPPAGIVAVVAEGRPHGLPVFDRTGKPFPMLTRLVTLRKAAISLTGRIDQGGRRVDRWPRLRDSQEPGGDSSCPATAYAVTPAYWRQSDGNNRSRIGQSSSSALRKDYPRIPKDRVVLPKFFACNVGIEPWRVTATLTQRCYIV